MKTFTRVKGLLTGLAAVIFLSDAAGQSTLQITFTASGTALTGADTVYMYSGVSPNNPGNFNQYTTGELVQPGTHLGLMTKIGIDQWSICLEPFSHFSQGTGGTIPAGTTLYGIGDITFHNKWVNGNPPTILVSINNTGFPFRIDMQVTSSSVIVPPTSNSIGQMTAAYQNCTLAAGELANPDFQFQVSPNPMSTFTRFIFRIQNRETISVRIFNSIGKEVKILTSTKQSNGSEQNTVYWNGDNNSGMKLADGLYFYSVSIDGKVVRSDKLIISR